MQSDDTTEVNHKEGDCTLRFRYRPVFTDRRPPSPPHCLRKPEVIGIHPDLAVLLSGSKRCQVCNQSDENKKCSSHLALYS